MQSGKKSQLQMLNVLYTVFLCYAVQLAQGDNQLQTILSRLECFKSEQKGCDKDFTEVLKENGLPGLSRSYDGSTTASTRFYMFTPRDAENPELMHKCGGELPPGSKYDPNSKLFIVFPGFVSGACHTSIYRELIYERQRCGSYNYLHIEWTWGNSFDLVTAVENQKIVANQTALIIRYLKEKKGLKTEDIICMGHSLGAHGCGLVGQAEPIFAIHGLDPAGVVYWEDQPLDLRLDAGDADCVQVTHCNAGQCLPGYFAVNFTCGTKDFWFNDGLNQPGCYINMFQSFLKGDTLYAIASLIPAACQHLQCLQYYKASMCPGEENCKFTGVECKNYKDLKEGKCSDCGEDGEKCDLTGFYSCDCNSGKLKDYYLKAGLHCPYCDDEYIKNRDRFSCPATGTQKPETEVTNPNTPIIPIFG